jgi:type I restriction-modification system DNA methylase subunit
VILANGSMSSNQSGEGQIREAMVRGDVVEVMVALPSQLFFNTQIPACVWFLCEDKTQGPRGPGPPGRYVGAADVEEDGEAFEEKMKRLTGLLKQQQEGAKLDAAMARKLAWLGFGAE